MRLIIRRRELVSDPWRYPGESGDGGRIVQPLAEFLEPPTSGIYSLVWRVEDIEAAETFFRQKGVRTTREACVSGGVAIDPRDFSSARHEFILA